MQNQVSGYERWAAQQRSQLERNREQRYVDESRLLNAAARACFESNNRRLDRLDDSSARMREEIQQAKNEIRSEFNQRMDEKFDELNGKVDQLFTILSNLNNGGPPAVGGSQVRRSSTDGSTTRGASREDLDAHIATRNSAIARRREQDRRQLVSERRSVEEALRATARLPQMPTKLPKSFRQLLQLWSTHGLDEFVNARRKDWVNSSIRQAYEKYLYLFQHLQKKNDDMNEEETMMETAQRLDRQLGKTTLATHLRNLKLNDPNVIPRCRTWRGARERGTGEESNNFRQSQQISNQVENRLRRPSTSLNSNPAQNRNNTRYMAHLESLQQQQTHHASGRPQRFQAHASGGIIGRRQPSRRPNCAAAQVPSPYDPPPENYECEDDQHNRYTSGGRFRVV